MNAGVRTSAADLWRGGLLLVDKPAGMTSFTLVGGVRKALMRAEPALRKGLPGPAGAAPVGGGRKPRPPRFRVGHAGTLDPMATGLMLVMVGKASRLSPFLMGMDKTYAATVRFGAATDSLDADGRITATAPAPAAADAVLDVLDRFRGAIMQTPPLISALKRDGKPLYERVRAGEDVAPPDARPVTIGRLEATEVRWDAAPDGVCEVDLLVDCSSGTYIRSLARDIAEAAGTLGHLTALRRLRVGPFGLDAAAALFDDAIAAPPAADGERPQRRWREGAFWAARLLAPAQALAHLPVITLDGDEAAAVRNGRQPDADWLQRLAAPVTAGGLLQLQGPAGELVAVARCDDQPDAPPLALAMVLPATDAAADSDPAQDGPSCG